MAKEKDKPQPAAKPNQQHTPSDTRRPDDPPAPEAGGTAPGDEGRYDPNQATGAAPVGDYPPSAEVGAKTDGPRHATPNAAAPMMQPKDAAYPAEKTHNGPRHATPQWKPYTQPTDAAVPPDQLGHTAHGPIRIDDVAGLFRAFLSDARRGDHAEAMEHAGLLMQAGSAVVARGQHAQAAGSVRQHHQALSAWEAFDDIGEGLEAVKAAHAGGAFGHAPADGSGSPAALGSVAHVGIKAVDWGQIIGVVTTLFDLFKQLRERRGA